MQLSNSPGKLVLPFASSGNKNAIPVNSQIGITPGAASLADGFPPLTMTPVAAGGVPPSGLDMNGILYEMSAIVRWANAGGGYPYDADFASSDDVGGYPKGARVLRADGSGYWFNTVDNNETDPDSGAAEGWVPDFTSGAATVPMASANVTLTPVQYGKPIIIITGTLTGNLNLVFPAIADEWSIINITTGAFYVTCKTSTGVGIKLSPDFVGNIVCDGVDVKSGQTGNDVWVIGSSGAVDDASKLTAALSICKSDGRRLRGVGAFTLLSTVNFREVDVDMQDAAIDVAHAGIGILIGGNANSGDNPPQRFGTVTRSVGSDSTTTPTIRAIGVKGQQIHVEFTSYFQVYADTHSVGETALRNLDYSSAYSSYWIKFATTVELTNNPANAGGAANSDPGGTVQWITENQFYLNRTANILINGTYAHNHNKFHNGTLEGTATINVDRGTDNWFKGMRFEAGPTTISFGTNSQRNVVECTWISSRYPSSVGVGISPLPNATITDNGLYNFVINGYEHLQRRNVIARASIEDPIYNNRVGLDSLRATYLQRVGAAGGSATLTYSAFQPVKAGDVYEFSSYAFNSGDTVQYRPALLFFDSSMKPVASAAGFVASPTLTTVSGNSVTTGSGAQSFNAAITAAAEAGATFVRAEWRSSSGQTVNGRARILEITRAAHYDWTGKANTAPEQAPRVVSAVPTQSFVPQGFQLNKSDGTAIYICSFSLDTATTGSVTSGATSVDVVSATGVTVGDIIGVNLDNRDTHWTTVASVTGLTIGLTDALPSAAASNSRTVFNRWATK